MRKNWNKYQDFVDSVIKLCGIMRTKTLENCLINYHANKESISREEAHYILTNLQNYSDLVLSADGYAMTRQMYITLTGDIHMDNLMFSDIYKVKEGAIKIEHPYHQAIIECMTVVADFMPDSLEFMMPENNRPWFFQFNVPSHSPDKPNRVFQVTKVESGFEINFSLMLAGESFANIKDSFKNCIRRIAIVNDEASAFMIPHLGFSAIIMYNPTSPREFKVIEKRTGDDIWSDYDDAKKGLKSISEI